jgi:hypothetical protein
MVLGGWPVEKRDVGRKTIGVGRGASRVRTYRAFTKDFTLREEDVLMHDILNRNMIRFLGC